MTDSKPRLDEWTERKVMTVGLSLYELVVAYGRVVPFAAWWTRICPQTSITSAQRRWERLKADWKEAGVEFKLAHPEDSGEGGRDLILSSQDQALAVVDYLIGPAIPMELTGAETRQIDSFFPGIPVHEVRELFAPVTPLE